MTEERQRLHPWQIILGGILLLVLIAVVDLGMQEVYHRYLYPPRPVVLPTSVPTAIPTQTPSPHPTVAPPPTPWPTMTPALTSTLTQTVVPTPLSFPEQQIQEALQQVTFRQLLLKAALELLRAEDYLASGEMKRVERELVAVSATLDQAADYAGESLQGTMDDLQRDLSGLREDLYLRPELLREGIRRLWQRIDVLIGG